VYGGRKCNSTSVEQNAKLRTFKLYVLILAQIALLRHPGLNVGPIKISKRILHHDVSSFL